MNRLVVGCVAGAFVSVGLGYIAGVVSTEAKVRHEYEESSRAYRRAMEMVEVKPVTAPVDTEEELDEPRTPTEFNHYVDSVIKFQPEPINPYHISITAVETPASDYVNGTPNQYGISYLEEEDFQEEDGRMKHTVTLLMDAHNPTFFMNGEEMEDWADRLGPSIVKDFLSYVPAGINPVLYVRNHHTEEDYEITPENP